MSDDILRTDGLTKRFGDALAVDEVSLAVERGEFFSLLGPSGCGKTTTLRMLAGLETPDAGTVTIDGQTVTDQPARERDTNLVFQDLVLFPHMSVAENVGYGLARAGVDRAERERRVRELLSVVDLEGFGDRDPGALSGGQRQRVALARALANEPAVLLLDEPLSSLDRALRQTLQEELRRIQREIGTTFLYVTHDQDSAMSMSDRIAVMRDGRIVETGSPEALYSRPRTAFVASFLGDANVIAGVVTGPAPDGPAEAAGTVKAADAVAVTASGGGLAFRAATGPCRPSPGERVTAMIRPEGLTVTPGDGDGAGNGDGDGDGGSPTAPGRVTTTAYKGFYEEYTVTLRGDGGSDGDGDGDSEDTNAGGPAVRVRSDRERRLTVGQSVRLRVDEARLVLADAVDGTTDAEPASSAIGAARNGREEEVADSPSRAADGGASHDRAGENGGG